MSSQRPTDQRPTDQRPTDQRPTDQRPTAARRPTARPDATGDDRAFEAEVRGALHDLAGPPAPLDLLARVAAIPEQEPRPRRLALGRGLGLGLPVWGRALAGLATVVAALVIAAGLFGLIGSLPGIGSPATGSPAGPSASPSGPVAVIGSPQPSGSSAAPSASASAPATATPGGATPIPTLTGPAGTVPVGFSPLSVTFVSASQGWVLGGAPCGDGSVRCAVIVRTADGGHTWTRTPAPATTVGQATGAWRDGATGVGGIRFADANDGWLFGPELWITHDGGATWQSQAVPGGSDSQVMTLEAHAGLVHAVVTDGDATHGFQVASSPVADDAWALAATSLRFGAGPVPTVQLVLSGTAGWIVEVDRDVTGGLRLGAGVWQAWRPPCSGANGAAVLAAYSASQLVAACDEGVWGPAPSGAAAGERLYVSSDGGTTFTRGAATIPLGSVQQLAQPTATTVVASGAQVVRSTDGGATWQTVLADSPGKEGTIYLGFTTASQGVLITGGRLGPNGLLMSYDGGRTWRPVTF